MHLLQSPRPVRFPVAAILLTLSPVLVAAQQAAPLPGTDSVTVTAGAQYKAGGLHQFFFGRSYRELWKAPIRAPVLDLPTHAGGLRAVRTGGGKQTRSLRFLAPSGAEYVFRSVDKDNVVMPSRFEGSVLEDIFRDQVSSSHPAGAVVAHPLLEAADVLHATPTLMVMPDDPGLGEFRQEFAGRLGMLERFPDNPEGAPGFAGALEIIDSERLLRLINAGPDDRVDAAAFLTARLMDVFLNDWDRHPGNWRWARMTTRPATNWRPIPRDRDKTLISYEGVIAKLARMAAPNLVPFKGTYPPVKGLTFNSIEFDRRLLAGLDKPIWDSVAAFLVSRLTDSVIDAAVLAVPPEYQTFAPSIAIRLKQRRDRLPDVAGRFYHYLAATVDVHATDAADRATITRVDDQTVEVRLEGGTARSTPYFRRRFNRDETAEIRVYLHGGDDRALVKNDVRTSIPIRIIGGEGTNVLTDSSRLGNRTNQARLYDVGAVKDIEYGPDTLFDRRPWIHDSDRLLPPGRDRGGRMRPILGIGVDGDLGIVPRVGLNQYRYGFRHRPYARRVALQAEYATRIGGARIELAGDQRLESSPLHFIARARMSEIEVIRFHGLGNATLGPSTDDFFEVDQRQWLFQTALALALGPRSDVSLGPVLQYSVSDSAPNRFLSTNQPYGFGEFGQAGLRLSLHHDVRDQPRFAKKGVLLDLSAGYFPEVWDVRSGFGEITATAAAYLTIPIPTHPIVALRSGGKKVFGDFPFHEAAFIGGGATVRSIDAQRYAGDAALFGVAEVRVPVASFSFILPVDFGIFGLVEAGRVYVDGESPGGWHDAAGGGFWVALIDPTTAISFSFTSGGERTAVFIKAGVSF